MYYNGCTCKKKYLNENFGTKEQKILAQKELVQPAAIVYTLGMGGSGMIHDNCVLSPEDLEAIQLPDSFLPEKIFFYNNAMELFGLQDP